jgi:hypothetical protein
MKRIIKGMLITCLFLPLSAKGQNEIDALRYSQIYFGSTARSISLGGAFGALGGDYTCLSTNPAGLGIYRKSDFSFTLGFADRNHQADFEGNRNDDDRFSLELPHIGVVLASGSETQSSDFAFGISYNRLASFNNSIFYKGKNTQNSILDSFLEEINSNGGVSNDQLFDLFPFDGDLAYQTYLINPTILDSNQYSSVIPDGGATQSMNLESDGSMGEFSLGLAGKADDYLTLGFSVGFPNIDYNEVKTYTETDDDNSIFVNDTNIIYNDFRALKYENFLKTSGTGFNMKAGMIVQPIDWMRVGLAVHTPTWFFMSDIYSSYMQSEFANGSFDYSSPEGNYTYRLTTSWRTIASMGFIIGKTALISLESEMVQYPRAKLRASDYNFQQENETINTIYKQSSFNFRAGGEWRYGPFSIRGGFGFYGSPFEAQFVDSKTDQTTLSYSGGVGYRGKKYYFDLGYVNMERGEAFRAYNMSSESTPFSTIQRTDNRVLTTFGWRF